MKLLIIGHARHGKDTVAEYISAKTALRFRSSSAVAAETIMYPLMRHMYGSVEECFEDRVNHRELWFNEISRFNGEDPGRLARVLLNSYDIYVGMRCARELEASAHLFDLIIWVDASERLQPESKASCTVSKRHADVIIDNNGFRADLARKLDGLCGVLRCPPVPCVCEDEKKREV